MPLLANMVEGGKTPILSAAELEALGFSLVIFPGGIVRALAKTARDYLRARSRAHGTTTPFRDRMFDFDELNARDRHARDARARQALRGGAIMSALDPVTLAVLKGRLEQIADEMDATLYRSAFNPIIAEAHDACHGLYHAATGATLVQGTTGLPIFVGAMAFAVKAVIDKVARDGGLAAGDTFIFNDPYDGGTHLNDFRLVRPFFRDGKLFCWLASVGHWHDVGGNVPGNYNPAGDRMLPGRQCCIPPVKLVARRRACSRTSSTSSRANSRVPPVELGRPQRPAQRARSRRARGCTPCSTNTATTPCTRRSTELSGARRGADARRISRRCPMAPIRSRTFSTTTASPTSRCASRST